MTPVAVHGPLASASSAATDTRRAYLLGAWTLALSLFGLIFLPYLLPPHADSFHWGLNVPGLRQFQAHWGLSGLPSLQPDDYSLAFRVLLLTAWMGYALFLLAGLQGQSVRTRPAVWVIAATALTVALLAPPLLSKDVYANASHGRIFALYGQNPYLRGPEVLVRAHDPVVPYLSWNMATIYGPVWTRIEIVAALLLRSSGLWAQIVALKVVGAGALLAAALAGRRLAARFAPARANLTLLAIGLNPLLLLEGPGAGHNDIVLMAFLLWAAVCYLECRFVRAALLLGLSVGVKPITLAVLPWLLLDYSRGRGWKRTLAASALAAVLIAATLAVAFGTLWHGPETLEAMSRRARLGLSLAALARESSLHDWLRAHGAGDGAATLAVTLWRVRVLGVFYALVTLALALRPAPGRWLLAWAAFSAALMFGLLGPSFPWYITWFWPICLLRWDRLHQGLSAACLALSLSWMSGYGMVAELRPGAEKQFWTSVDRAGHTLRTVKPPLQTGPEGLPSKGLADVRH